MPSEVPLVLECNLCPEVAPDSRAATSLCSVEQFANALQAGIALRACVLVLEDAIRPHNCFWILGWAASTGNQRLFARAGAVALLHFKQAGLEDMTGLRLLPKEVLGALLSHDCLQVRSP